MMIPDRTPRRERWTQRSRGEPGLTLVELLMAVSILSIMALAFFSLTHATLRSWSYAADTDEATESARIALERISESIRNTNRVLLPFQRAAGDTSTHRVLCVALGVDNDGDGRIDEDSYDVYHDGIAAGIPGIDDDRDGDTDEGSPYDDDEGGGYDEESLDGIDQDGDGRIDEDWGMDMNGDGEPGVAYVDDDGDGSVDEGNPDDDDEDGFVNEDPIEPIVYYVDTSSLPPVLVEDHPVDGKTVLAENLYFENNGWFDDGFIVTRLELQDGTTLVHLRLRLMTEEGGVVEFTTTVTSRNGWRIPQFTWKPHEIAAGF